MVEKTLIDAIVEAIDQLDTYKNPDVSEIKKRLDVILCAAGLGSIARDSLDSMYLGKENLEINTSWSSRGCSMGDTKSIPRSILESSTVLVSANRWRLDNKLKEAERKLDGATYSLREARKNMDAVKDEIEAFEKDPTMKTFDLL